MTFVDVAGRTIKSFQVRHGEKVGWVPENPTRVGYSFSGWKSGSSTITENTTVTSDLIVAPTFTAITYTITYNLEGGTWTASGKKTSYKITDSDYSPPTPNPTRTGYTFNGWVPASIPTGYTGNRSFTATWQINTYTITLDANGGVPPT